MKTAPFSQKAIMQAYAGAAKMTEQGYLLQQYAPGAWYLIITPVGRRYRVRPFGQGDRQAVCNCPQASAEGICKHQVWAAELLNTIGEQVHADAEATARLADVEFDSEGDSHQTTDLYE